MAHPSQDSHAAGGARAAGHELAGSRGKEAQRSLELRWPTGGPKGQRPLARRVPLGDTRPMEKDTLRCHLM